MSSTNNFHAFDGEELEINCSVEVDLYARVELRWELPRESTAMAEGRVEIKNGSHKHPTHGKVVMTSNLKIERVVNRTDSGLYHCVALSSGQERSTKRLIKIIGRSLI